MAEPIKSALFLDYEGLQRAMSDGERTGDARLAERATAWLAAIESGRLIGPKGTHRRLLTKRCYAGPGVRGKLRDALASAGFEVVDCGTGDAARGSTGLLMAMDTVEAIRQSNGPDEFIILGGGADLAPVLARVKSANRAVVVYAGAKSPDSVKALADAVLDGADFAAFLASDEHPGAKSAGTSATDRAEIEAFARRIHAATNIPLFSPKTYAEFFHALTEEIREKGYHFQMTAKNVADRMTADGRSVTRRQVVFIVKGLALKGHVFSTDDTAERLAEVFRDQAQYLITNAGISLDEKQSRLLSAWFTSRSAASAEPDQAEKPAAKSKAPAAEAPPPQPEEKAPPPKAKSAPSPEPEPEAEAVNEAGPEPKAEAPKRPAPAPQDKTRPVTPRPSASTRVPTVKPAEQPKSAAKPPSAPAKQPAREDAHSAIAARIAASAKLKPGTRGPAAKPPAQQPAREDEPAHEPPTAERPARPNPAAAAPRSQPAPTPARGAPDALEDSILAAIAEAVDVLVEDGIEENEAAPEDTAPPRRRPAAKARRAEPQPEPQPEPEAAAEPEPEPEPEPSDEDTGGDDIGDQIQRIIATYNRNRSDT